MITVEIMIKRSLIYMSQIQEQVFDKLNTMGIKYKAVWHPAVYTVEDINQLCIPAGNEVAKNLFLHDDKKKRYFLVVLPKDKKVDLKELRVKLNSRRLSFASEEELHTYMGLNKGSVTPFGILNDNSCSVEVIFDQDLVLFQEVGVHPNENTATVWLHAKDLEKVIREHGNNFAYIEI